MFKDSIEILKGSIKFIEGLLVRKIKFQKSILMLIETNKVQGPKLDFEKFNWSNQGFDCIKFKVQ